MMVDIYLRHLELADFNSDSDSCEILIDGKIVTNLALLSSHKNSLVY